MDKVSHSATEVHYNITSSSVNCRPHSDSFAQAEKNVRMSAMIRKEEIEMYRNRKEDTYRYALRNKKDRVQVLFTITQKI
jgi:hypothetical protein